MFHVKLYRECDIGGAHSGGLKIQGLLAKQNEAQTAVNQQDQNKPSKYDEIMQRYISGSIEEQTKSFEKWLDEYQKPSYVGPSQGSNPFLPKTRIPSRSNPYPMEIEDHNYLAEYMKSKLLPKKSEFEVIIDALFTFEEKISFLESLGYTQDSMGKFYKADSQAPSGELHKLFLYEITIKFKNVLLSKGTIKLKF